MLICHLYEARSQFVVGHGGVVQTLEPAYEAQAAVVGIVSQSRGDFRLGNGFVVVMATIGRQ